MPFHKFDYLFAFGTIFATLDAYNIGANDVANVGLSLYPIEYRTHGFIIYFSVSVVNPYGGLGQRPPPMHVPCPHDRTLVLCYICFLSFTHIETSLLSSCYMRVLRCCLGRRKSNPNNSRPNHREPSCPSDAIDFCVLLGFTIN
jgi:hypothetical protein